MTTEIEHERLESREVLEEQGDLLFYAGLVRSETARLTALLRSYLSPGDAVSSEAVEQILRLFGELSARVHVIEQVAEQQMFAESPLHVSPLLVGNLKIQAIELEAEGLAEPEGGEGHDTVRWTETPEICIQLSAYRPVTKRLRVYFQAIIKSEYAKSLHLVVDGQRLSHKVRKTPDGLCLECLMPPAQDLALTNMVLRLPAVHSPKDLGVSDDARELGIALKEIRVDNVSGAKLPRFLTR